MDRPQLAWYQPSLLEGGDVFVDVRVWVSNRERLAQLSYLVKDPLTDEVLGLYVKSPQDLTVPRALLAEAADLLLPLLNQAVNPF